MEIKLSEIKLSTPIHLNLYKKLGIIIIAIILAIITWYFITSASTVLVITKNKSGKKSCDFN